MDDQPTTAVVYERYEFDPRYFIHTAKNNITSFGHVIAEALSNADEAITKRAARDNAPDEGSIHIKYDPDSTDLVVTDDGIGLTGDGVRARLRRVGAETTPDARRAFFHRGIREVFMAMGESIVESIAFKDGAPVFTKAVFHPTRGIALVSVDQPVTPALREACGLAATGTRVTVPLRPLVTPRPTQFTFPKLVDQIENCVQVRPVLLDDKRRVEFEFGDAPIRAVRFSYPRGESLISAKPVKVGNLAGTLWAAYVQEPIKSGGSSRQTRRYGILVRGERAAYEVSLGTQLAMTPAHRQMYGELRIDGIEVAQRAADATADDDAQLIYKADRSGLNPDHPIVEAIYAFLDTELGPLMATLESKEKRQRVSEDVKRQLHDLARVINEAVSLEDLGDLAAPRGSPRLAPTTGGTGPVPPEGPSELGVPIVEDGIAFAFTRLFIAAGKLRTVRVYVDTSKIPPGSPIAVDSLSDGVLRGALLSAPVVPDPPEHGVAQLSLTLQATDVEGRHEVTVRAGGYAATLPIYVRFPRATGFIRDIELVDEDWESGAAFYNAQTGRVTVYVGRPEFVAIARRAQKEHLDGPFSSPIYRLAVVESVREAALGTAAQRRAEVLFDDLPAEERRERDALSGLVLTEYQALDYRLRKALIESFVYG